MTERPWQVERDRFGIMFSGPLEVGAMVEVVPVDFHGLLTILDTNYSAEVFTGASEDVGARLVMLARELATLHAVVHGHVQVIRGMCTDEVDHREIDRALVRLDNMVQEVA